MSMHFTATRDAFGRAPLWFACSKCFEIWLTWVYPIEVCIITQVSYLSSPLPCLVT